MWCANRFTVVCCCLLCLVYAQEESGDIAQIAATHGFSSLVRLLMQVNLRETLMEKGSFTLFAPTNEAFATLNPISIRHMMLSDERLKKILLHHIVPGKILSQDISHGFTTPTLQGEPLNFTVSFTGMKVNNASIIDGNIKASNGIIHVINRVLLPSEEIEATEIAKNSTANIMEVTTKAGLSSFVKYLKDNGLSEFLSTQGTFTVFAPSNEAFSELSPTSMRFLNDDKDMFRSILLYHILPGEIPSSDFINDLQMATIQGQNTRFNKFVKHDKTISTVNGANIMDRDILATNGIIHIINKVMIPPSGDTMDVLEKDSRYTILVDAIRTAGLYEFLKADSSLTLFAPTNDAFDTLEKSLLEDAMTKKGILSEIILRHVILGHHHGPLFSSALCWDTVISANNVLIHTGMGDKGIMKIGSPFGNASIIETDLMAVNGVIHAIDAVI